VLRQVMKTETNWQELGKDQADPPDGGDQGRRGDER